MADEEVLTEGQAADGEHADGTAKTTGEQSVPYHRFKEVNDKLGNLTKQLEAYVKLGDPTKIAGEMERLKELAKTNEFTPSEKEAISKQLFTLFPELKDLVANAPKLLAAARQAENTKENYIAESTKQTNGYLDKLGLPVNDKNNIRLQELLVAELRQPENKQKMVAYLRGDRTVLDEMFKIVQREVFGGSRRAQGAALEQVKKPLAPIGKIQPKAAQPDKKPLTDNEKMNEANEAAYELISQMET